MGLKHGKEKHMAKYKNRGKKKKYSSEEKYRYHSSRDVSCSKYGLKYGSTKHCYSTGFADGFQFIDNRDGIKHQFGKSCSNAYAIGNKRGKAAGREYFLRTKKHPVSLNKFE